MKYKVGDKVRVKKDLKLCQRYYMENKKGGVNTFVPPMTDYRGQMVTISKIINGQYCVKECPYGTNHKPVLWTDGMFDSSDEKIVIIASGMKTIAKLYNGDKIAKTAIARCSPEDTFDFAEGARLAFGRLWEAEETERAKPQLKYYSGKVVCTCNNADADSFTVGKIYEFVNGTVVDDDGDVRYKFCPLNSILNLKIVKFIPLIENRKEKK